MRAEIKANSNTHHNNHNNQNNNHKINHPQKIKSSIDHKGSKDNARQSVNVKHNNKIIATEPYEKKSFNFSKMESKIVESIFGRDKKVASLK
jgi:hypothetical protein